MRNLFALSMNHGCAANVQLDVHTINSHAEYKYFLGAICHFCKHLLLSATKENTSEVVSKFFTKVNTPKHFMKMSTDGGSTVIAKQMRLLKSDINYAIKKHNLKILREWLTTNTPKEINYNSKGNVTETDEHSDDSEDEFMDNTNVDEGNNTNERKNNERHIRNPLKPFTYVFYPPYLILEKDKETNDNGVNINGPILQIKIQIKVKILGIKYQQ